MPYPWTPRDYAVGNQLLPMYQMIAQNQRRLAMQQAMSGQPMAALSARAPTGSEPLELAPPEQYASTQFVPRNAMMGGGGGGPVRPPSGLISREQAAIFAGGSGRQPFPNVSGAGQSGADMTPDERGYSRMATMAGMASGLQNVLSQNPRAGIGAMLLGAGTGTLQGQLAGREGIRMERREDRRDELLEYQIRAQEAEAQQKIAAQHQMERFLADPSLPPEQRRAIQASMAGVPAAGVEAMLGPKPMTEYQRESLDIMRDRAARAGALTPYQAESLALQREALGKRGALTPYQQQSLELQRLGLEQNAPLEEVLDPEKGAVYATRGEARGKPVPPSASRAGAGTSLMQNAPFVSKALGISEGEATKMLLAPTSGRQSWDQFEREAALRFAGQPGMGRKPGAAADAARTLRTQLEGGAEGAPMMTEAPTAEGYDFPFVDPSTWLGGEEEATATPPPYPEAPVAPGAEPPSMPAGAIESMGMQELEALDTNNMSKADLARAAARMDALYSGY